jgi:hypothetical protein
MRQRTIVEPNKVYKINQERMSDYDKLKQVIQAANPEIMELKFACEVMAWYGEDCLSFTVLSESIVCRKHKVWKDECYEEDNTDESVLAVELSDEGAFTTNLLKEKSDAKIYRPYVYEILGRPIRLADVLLAIEETSNQAIVLDSRGRMTDINTATSNGFHNAIQWNLKDDNLDHQSDECKEFLIKLLVTV